MRLAALAAAAVLAAGSARADDTVYSPDCGAGVKVPNYQFVLEAIRDDYPDLWAGKLLTDEAACRADARWLDMVVDGLRNGYRSKKTGKLLNRGDKRFGYNCKRGNCNDPSHDVISYYFGSGDAYNGAIQVMLVDIITSSCAPDAHPGWNRLPFGPGVGFTSKGRFKTGPKLGVRCTFRSTGNPDQAMNVGPGGVVYPGPAPAGTAPSSPVGNVNPFNGDPSAATPSANQPRETNGEVIGGATDTGKTPIDVPTEPAPEDGSGQ